jgi:hypothetical protein
MRIVAGQTAGLEGVNWGIANVRFGSEADIGDGEIDVRSTPKADIPESDWHVRFVPKADIQRERADAH